MMSSNQLFARIFGSTLILLVASVATPTGAGAQEPGFSFAVGIDGLADYPKQLRTRCDEGFGVGATGRLRYRVSTIVSAELGLAIPFEVARRGDTVAGGRCPAGYPGTTVTTYPRGSPTVVPEARVALTPYRMEDFAALRIVAGGAWFIARGAPAAIIGVGIHPQRVWRFITFDVEYWSVSVPYDVTRFGNQPGAFGPDVIGSGRVWEGLLLLRLGVQLWPRINRSP